MIAYRYNPGTMVYDGEQECQRDPVVSARMGKDVWLLPMDCTYTPPPENKEGHNIMWNGEAWEYQEIPVEPEPEPKPEPEPYVPTLEDQIRQLDGQYKYEKHELMGYYMEFMLDGDTGSMDEIKAELITLAERYDADLAALKGGEE